MYKNILPSSPQVIPLFHMWGFSFYLHIFYFLFYEPHLFISLNCVLSDLLTSICNLLIFSSALLCCFTRVLRFLKHFVFHNQSINLPLFRNSLIIYPKYFFLHVSFLFSRIFQKKILVENLFQIAQLSLFLYICSLSFMGVCFLCASEFVFRESCFSWETSFGGGPKFACRPVFMLTSHSHFMKGV